MILANRRIVPPEEWNHSNTLINSKGETVAMLFAFKGMLPP